MTTESAPRFLTTQDAADQTGLSVHTIRDALQNGRLDGYWYGNRWRISQKGLDAFMEQFRVPARLKRR